LTKNTTQIELRQFAQRFETYSASRHGEEADMDRNIEKFIKIECPKEISGIKLDPAKHFSTIPKLDLENIEPYTETGITVHIDLGLDQIEESEE
jgi:hypothetical protein